MAVKAANIKAHFSIASSWFFDGADFRCRTVCRCPDCKNQLFRRTSDRHACRCRTPPGTTDCLDRLRRLDVFRAHRGHAAAHRRGLQHQQMTALWAQVAPAQNLADRQWVRASALGIRQRRLRAGPAKNEARGAPISTQGDFCMVPFRRQARLEADLIVPLAQAELVFDRGPVHPRG